MMQPHLKPRLGKIITTKWGDETVRAYVPRPLPPEPALDLARLLPMLTRADQALGRLDGIATVLPSTALFVFMYVRKEALLSSQIEGTQSSLSDLLLFENSEAPLVPLDDVVEVSNYIRAMDYGLKRLKDDLPLSLRLLKDTHRELLSKGRGENKQPGEFRTSQNWIGGSRPGKAIFVPPPPDEIMNCLGNLETFLHDKTTYPILIRAALAHVQFETIHPFLDGNGRLGRLLITLMLCEEDVLKKPILYLSLYLKENRARYYELLQAVREKGDWESWVEFFLDGVAETAEQGISTARRLMTLFDDDEKKISKLGRAAPSALRLHMELKRTPMVAVPLIAKKLGISQPTIQKALDHLSELKIVKEMTGKRRSRVYSYHKYLSILEEGTEPLKD
jgi:Fic family protein